MEPVYLDHNATTPLEPRALEAMRPWLETCGNPSSLHAFGRKAREAVESARDRVAALLGASPQEIVFTASGTEANNAVLHTVAQTWEGGHLVVSAFEHPSILAAAAALERRGFAVSRVRPRPDGRVEPAAVAEVLRDDTRLVCLMLANNEIGTLQPVAEVASLAHERGARVLCDAVQAIGKVPVDVVDLGVDYLSIGAHKFYGPLGAAALWSRRGAELVPFHVGGSQERRRRAGTLNVPALVGFGAAAELARTEGVQWARHAARVRDAFEEGLDAVGRTVVHGGSVPRLPNTSNVAFRATEAEALMVRLDLRGFAVSTGSACHSGIVEMSETMRAIGATEEEAVSSLRLSFGKASDPGMVPDLLAALVEEVGELRALRHAEAKS
jgi:cysteine desulfurase